jgi:hypothetical protein
VSLVRQVERWTGTYMSQNDLSKTFRQPRSIPLQFDHNLPKIPLERFGDGHKLLDIDEEVGGFEGGDDGRFSLLRKGAEGDGVVLWRERASADVGRRAEGSERTLSRLAIFRW